MQKIRVRFAPSPTGYLHIGGLRTALYNYLFAKKNNGTFVLRIEDTDQARLVEGAVQNLIDTLNWADITFDEGPGKEGACGPYVQSERLPLYQKHAKELIQKGHAYYCFCTVARLESVRQRQIEAKLPAAYDRHCRKLDSKVIEENLSKNEPYVIRMKIPLIGELTFNDIIRGPVTINYKNVDDQVLLKSDGFPTYHLAVVVDDHYMEISHVIRGEEWLPSTPKHLLLYEYFGWQAPEFAHLPLLLNPDRSKLSKRQGDVAVEDYRAKGYLKETLVNFVALLGWNPGGEREIFSLQELVSQFSLENVNKSGSVFDIDKLNWMNGLYIRQKSAKELFDLIIKDVNQSFEKEISLNHQQVLRLIDLCKERAKTLKELSLDVIKISKAPEIYEQAALDEFIKVNSSDYLKKVIELLEQLEDFKTENISLTVKNLVKQLNIKLPEIAQPIRIALTGTVSSPGIFDLINVLSKEESVSRLKKLLDFINRNSK